MSNYDRVSVIVGVILVGAVLLQVLQIPSRTFEFRPLGTPLTVNITGTWVVSVLLVGLSCAGTEALMHTHPAVRRGTARHTFQTWILPGLSTMAMVVLLPRSPALVYWLFGLGVGGAALAWSILAGHSMLGRDKPPAAASQVPVNLLTYLLALVYFAVIYRTRLRSLASATAVAAVAFLLSLHTLYLESLAMRRRLLYAGAIGLVLGETTWALNYWRADALAVGVLMMLLFYVLLGTAREHVRSSVGRWAVLEFLVVAGVGVWIIVRLGRR